VALSCSVCLRCAWDDARMIKNEPIVCAQGKQNKKNNKERGAEEEWRGKGRIETYIFPLLCITYFIAYFSLPLHSIHELWAVSQGYRTTVARLHMSGARVN
jgi:hypothetical protein